MTTLTDFLDNLVGTAFKAAKKTSALTSAALVLGVTAADDDDSDMAIALYAAGLLQRTRAVEQNRTDSNVSVPTIESLLTEDIKRLITKDDQSTYAGDLIVFTPHDHSSSKHWTNSRS